MEEDPTKDQLLHTSCSFCCFPFKKKNMIMNVGGGDIWFLLSAPCSCPRSFILLLTSITHHVMEWSFYPDLCHPRQQIPKFGIICHDKRININTWLKNKCKPHEAPSSAVLSLNQWQNCAGNRWYVFELQSLFNICCELMQIKRFPFCVPKQRVLENQILVVILP